MYSFHVLHTSGVLTSSQGSFVAMMDMTSALSMWIKKEIEREKIERKKFDLNISLSQHLNYPLHHVHLLVVVCYVRTP